MKEKQKTKAARGVKTKLRQGAIPGTTIPRLGRHTGILATNTVAIPTVRGTQGNSHNEPLRNRTRRGTYIHY